MSMLSEGKARLLRKIVGAPHIPAKAVIFGGDEVRNIEDAHAVGISLIAVSWGYHARELLMKSGPDAIVDRPQDLLRSFKALTKPPQNKSVPEKGTEP